MPAWRRDKQDILSVINRKLGHSAHPNPERMNAKLTSPSTCTNCWRSRCKPSWHPSWHPPYPQSPSVRSSAEIVSFVDAAVVVFVGLFATGRPLSLRPFAVPQCRQVQMAMRWEEERNLGTKYPPSLPSLPLLPRFVSVTCMHCSPLSHVAKVERWREGDISEKRIPS